MSVVLPPTKNGKDRPLKNNKSYLNECLAANMRELVRTEDGRTISKAQAITERVSNMAMFAESNSDALAAAKFIYERLGGKASVMKDDDIKPMPKVVFALNDDGIKKVNDAPNQPDLPEPEENDDGLIHAFIDGNEWVDEPVGELDD